jgi:hypothetical protein
MDEASFQQEIDDETMIIALYLIALFLALIAAQIFILLTRITGVNLKLRVPYKLKDTEASKMNGVSKIGIKL